MFITSRESAIVANPFHRSGPVSRAGFFPAVGQTWEKIPSLKICVRVNFGVLSIYQPGNCQGQGVSSGFTGFYTCFLENALEGVALLRYGMWHWLYILQPEGVFIHSVQ